MLALIIMIFVIAALFKATIWSFHLLGVVFGWILGIIGWLIVAGLAVTVFGLTVIAAPIILAIGIVALIMAAVI